MITRIFRVRVPGALRAEFEEKLLSVFLPYVKAAPGLVSVSVGRPTSGESREYVIISVWSSEESVSEFVGENWNKAVIPPGMEKYLSMAWIHHYENFGSLA